MPDEYLGTGYWIRKMGWISVVVICLTVALLIEVCFPVSSSSSSSGMTERRRVVESCWRSRQSRASRTLVPRRRSLARRKVWWRRRNGIGSAHRRSVGRTRNDHARLRHWLLLLPLLLIHLAGMGSHRPSASATNNRTRLMNTLDMLLVKMLQLRILSPT